MKRHIAFLNIPGHGHVTPTLAVVAELVRRGHRVSYATTEDFADAVAATGARVLRYDSTITPATMPEMSTGDDAIRWPLVFLEESIAILRRVEPRLAGDRPDLIAYDVTALYAGRILARKWNRPAVQLFPIFPSNEQFSLVQQMFDRAKVVKPPMWELVKFHQKLVKLLAAHGIKGVPIQNFLLDTELSNLVFLPRAFQFAGETFDQRYTFAGPCLEDGEPASLWQPPGNGHQVVLVSLGTAFNHRPEFFRDCARGFTGLPWHVVMTTGQRPESADLGPLPPNVEVHQWIPHPAVLRHARVFVCHGGIGSMMELLYYSVPLVVVPQTPEHAVNAARVAELGLGRLISREEVTADRLRAAVLEVAQDEAIRLSVREMQRQIHQAGGATRAVTDIEAYLKQAL